MEAPKYSILETIKINKVTIYQYGFGNAFCYRQKMFDTVKIWLAKENTPYTDLLTEVAPLIDVYDEKDSRKFGPCVLGKVNNLHVDIKETGLWVTGSLCKFFYGNNLKTLDRRTTKDAIMMLSDTLHLPFDLARVSRIDFSENIYVEKVPAEYLKCFGNASRYEKRVYPFGLNYINGRRKIVFYDKVKELKKHDKPTFATIEPGKNILRYEVQLVKYLLQQFNMPKLLLSMIHEEGFYSQCLSIWEREYLKVHKEKRIILNPVFSGNTKEFENTIFHMGINAAGGQNAVIDLIDQGRMAGASKMSIKRLKDKVQKANKAEQLVVISDLTSELDMKIKEVVARERDAF